MSEARKFLLPGAGKGAGSNGYTSKPLREVHDDLPETRERIAAACSLRDEPEAVSGNWVNAFTELAALYRSLQLQEAHEQAKIIREKLDVSHRILDVQRRAKERRIDYGHELGIIRKMLEKGNARAVDRLEKLEAFLDGVLEQAA